MRRSLEVIAACPITSIDRTTMNQQAVAGCRTPGEGIFTQQLRRRLAHVGITVPFVEYDIVAEMGGEAQNPVAECSGGGGRHIGSGMNEPSLQTSPAT